MCFVSALSKRSLSAHGVGFAVQIDSMVGHHRFRSLSISYFLMFLVPSCRIHLNYCILRAPNAVRTILFSATANDADGSASAFSTQLPPLFPCNLLYICFELYNAVLGFMGLRQQRRRV
eukprot:TRINITY_DN3571_c0_g1_i3.p1 TRINITY_DN3571_c0_g1~~TRINITY_DN3571_c0_g1_i3.p1  ORF type:complete len:119 (-),score=0.51 TRINITY_DN3571_c0_g1_i3:612-968(-)